MDLLYLWISICRLIYDQIQIDGFTIPVDFHLKAEISPDPDGWIITCGYPYVG
jgi:hypothetical protein